MSSYKTMQVTVSASSANVELQDVAKKVFVRGDLVMYGTWPLVVVKVYRANKWNKESAYKCVHKAWRAEDQCFVLSARHLDLVGRLTDEQMLTHQNPCVRAIMRRRKRCL